MGISQQLHLDVPGPFDELFDKDAGAAEGGLAFPLGTLEGSGKFVLAADNPHAPAAAAMGGLEDHRIAEAVGNGEGVVEALDRLGRAGQNRHPGPLGQVAGGGLVAEIFQQFHPRPDKDDAGLATGPGKLGVLRQEAIAGVNGIDIVGPGKGHDALNVEVAAQRLTRLADQVGLVGLEAVQREAVFVSVNGDCPHAQFMGRAKDADGDFTAIGDEELLDGSGLHDTGMGGEDPEQEPAIVP